MCLIVFSYKSSKKYPLVIAANRDEFYKRPTLPAGYWDDNPAILAGRDLEAKGTWMGVTRTGRVSMLTNYRDLRNSKSDAPSRGNIVADFLKTDMPAKSYLHNLDIISHAYNGFNLVLGNWEDLWYYSNQTKKITRLGSGIYGLSNALLDTPWPKVARAKNRIGEAMQKDSINSEEILDLLFDNQEAPIGALPDTGVGQEREKLLSPIFIKSENYGTRCSTLLTIDIDGQISFKERTYNTKTFAFESREFELKLIK